MTPHDTLYFLCGAVFGAVLICWLKSDEIWRSRWKIRWELRSSRNTFHDRPMSTEERAAAEAAFDHMDKVFDEMDRIFPR